jgi:hypothetical protein
VAIAAARLRAAEQSAARCKQLLAEPKRYRHDTIQVRRLARQHPDVLLPGWRAIVQSPQQPFEQRLAAATFLCGQNDDAGLDFLLWALREGPVSDRGQVLSEMNNLLLFERRWLGRRGEELDSLLLLQLDERLVAGQPNLIPLAALACKERKVSGVAEAAARLWEKELSPWSRRALAELLPPHAKTLAALRPLETALRQPGLSDFDLSESLRSVACFLNSPDPDTVQQGLSLVQQHFPWERDELAREGSGSSSWWYPIIEETGKRGGQAAVPLLHRFLQSRLNAAYRSYALRALAELLGKEALPLIEEMLRDPRMEPWAVEALGVAFKGTADAAQVARLKALAAVARDDWVVGRIAEALAAIGGSEAQSAAQSGLPADPLSPCQRPALQAFTHDTTLAQACSRLEELGVVPALSEADLRQLRQREGEKPLDWSLAILGHAGLLTWFDTETGEVPCPHDQLIRDFTEGSRGLFQPEAVLQEDGENDQADCVAQFIFRDRLYRFQARNFNDYYDVERTVAAINRALRDAGMPERFVEMDTGDQTACFLFGEPGRLELAAQEFRWPLADDSNPGE